MIGKNTGITCKELKPYQLAKIVGYRFYFNDYVDYSTTSVIKAFGTLILHNGSVPIIVWNSNNYFFGENHAIGEYFNNPAYYLEIISEPKPQQNKTEIEDKKFNLNDVLNLKVGDVFYYNYSHLKCSKRCIFKRLMTYDDELSNTQKLRICYHAGFFSDVSSYLTDCGVIPYSRNNKFNSTNSLTKEPLFPIK